MSILLQELKRRNVFKVGLAYLVVGWLTIQVVNSITLPLNLPVWVPTLVIVLLALGLPMALLFAWAFELTPEGIKKTTQVDPKQSLTTDTNRKIDFVIIGALTLIIVGLVYDRMAISPPPIQATEPASTTPSIAVLPFKDMSEKGNQAYMGEGIADELLNALAQETGLDVTSRTSSFLFGDGKTSSLEIGRKLNVNPFHDIIQFPGQGL